MAIRAQISGGAGSFDSDLSVRMVNGTTNAELTLTLRVFFVRVPGGRTIRDANNTEYHTRDWSTRAWTNYIQRYEREGQRYWHGKFWLASPAAATDLHWPRTPRSATHRANVWCRFNLQIAGSRARGHKTIRLARLVVPAGRTFGAGTFRSHEELYDDFDLGEGVYVRDGVTYRQRTFIHEIGHALGLPHVGTSTMAAEPTCTAADPNADACYGVLPANRENVMGFGMTLTTREARPWLDRVEAHTGVPKASWTTQMARVYPQALAAARVPAGAHP